MALSDKNIITYCKTCGFVYREHEEVKHVCVPNIRYCKYLYTILEQYEAGVFYCFYCGRINLSCQKVVCMARMSDDVLENRIPLPFSCHNLECKFHIGKKASFCENSPNLKNKLIHQYRIHAYEREDFLDPGLTV